MISKKFIITFFLLFFTICFFGVIRTMINEQYDYFAYSSWINAKAVETEQNINLLKYMSKLLCWVHHPIVYQDLFIPYYSLALITIVSQVRYIDLSLVLTLLYVLIFYIIMLKVTKENIVISFIGTLILLTRHAVYPTYAVFYISLGVVYMFINIYILIVISAKIKVTISEFIISLVLIITLNYSYYSATYLYVSVTLFMVFSCILRTLFINRQICNYTYLFSIFIFSLVVFVISNPGVYYYHPEAFNLADIFFRFLYLLFQRPTSDTFVFMSLYPVYYEVFRILSNFSRVSFVLILVIFLFSVIRYRYIHYIIMDNHFYIISSFLFATIPFAIIYLSVGYPSLHLYPLTSIGIPLLVAYIIAFLHRIVYTSYRLYLLLILSYIFILIAPLFMTIIAAFLPYVDPERPIFIYRYSTNAVYFLSSFFNNNKTIIFTDGRLAAFAYYLMFDQQTKIDRIPCFSPFRIDPLDIATNCKYSKSFECMYFLSEYMKYVPIHVTEAGNWGTSPPLSDKIYVIINSSRTIIYTDEYSLLLIP